MDSFIVFFILSRHCYMWIQRKINIRAIRQAKLNVFNHFLI